MLKDNVLNYFTNERKYMKIILIKIYNPNKDYSEYYLTNEDMYLYYVTPFIIKRKITDIISNYLFTSIPIKIHELFTLKHDTYQVNINELYDTKWCKIEIICEFTEENYKNQLEQFYKDNFEYFY